MVDVSEVLTSSKELYDPIFIVGCMRSGTGVLAGAIGLAESVCYFGETKLMTRYYTEAVPLSLAINYYKNGEDLLPVFKGKIRKIQDRIKGKNALRKIIMDMIRYLKLNGYDLNPGNHLIDRYNVELTPEENTVSDKLYKKYRQISRKETDRMLRILLKDFQTLSGKDKILEKTPLHALYIPTLQRVFPEAKICHIIRDGRDVAASYLVNYGKKKLNYRSIRHICNVYKRIRLVDEQIRKSNNPRYFNLKYEDFIRDPITSIEGVFKFLDLTLSDCVINALRDVKPTPSNWSKLPTNIRKYIEHSLEAVITPD